MASVMTAVTGCVYRRYSSPRILQAISGMPGARSLHASSSNLKKQSRKSIEEEEYDESENDQNEDETDLFDIDTPSNTLPTDSSNQTLTPRKIHRAQTIQNISYDSKIPTSLSGLSRSEAKSLRKSLENRSEKGALRNVVQLTETSEECEDLKRVLRDWRILGRGVGVRAGMEIVARCRKLGRPDVALELLADPVQYGLPPLPASSLTKLHEAFRRFTLRKDRAARLPDLPSSIKLSPTLALVRLDLVQQTIPAEGSDATDIVNGIVEAIQPIWKDHINHPVRSKAVRRLEKAGGVWAEACSRILALEATGGHGEAAGVKVE